MEIVEHCKTLRKTIKAIAEEVKASHEKVFEQSQGMGTMDEDEMHANLTIAYRHLEDAAMRIGKVIQAYDGGKSVYD